MDDQDKALLNRFTLDSGLSIKNSEILSSKLSEKEILKLQGLFKEFVDAVRDKSIDIKIPSVSAFQLGPDRVAYFYIKQNEIQGFVIDYSKNLATRYIHITELQKMDKSIAFLIDRGCKTVERGTNEVLFTEAQKEKIAYVISFIDNPTRAGPAHPPVGIDDDFIR